jgi:flagellar protein FlaG
MSRIDALLATQVSDVVRPVQVQREQVLQVAAARQRLQAADADDGSQLLDERSPQDVKTAVAHVKRVIEAASGHQLSFAVDDSGKTLLVKIVGEKGQVIRQIPSQEVLDLRKRINALVGALIDEKA